MAPERQTRMKDRRDIGVVVFPIEKMMAARRVSSSCVGVEALLEVDSKSIRKGYGNAARSPLMDKP